MAARRHRQKRAFTLIEFIVVMTIIGILAALIVPRVVGRIGQAKQAVSQQKISVLESKVMEFQVDCGRFPASQEGLGALIQAPSDVGDRWRGPYVKPKDILDPWGTELSYRCPGQHGEFDIYTYGADGQEGGEGDNADIGNW